MMVYPTDAVADLESVAEFTRLGGLAILSAEDIWARHTDIQDEIVELVELAKNVATKHEPEAVNHELQELHSAPINTDPLVERIKEVRATGATTAARASPQHARKLAPLAIKTNIDLLVTQGTLISAEHVTARGEPLSLRDFTGSLDVPVIVGGVVDYQAALHLMRSDTAGVIVGTGLTMSPDALGIDAPTIATIADAAAARKDHLDETEGHYVHIIAGSGIDTVGDVVEAIARGADTVVLSSVLATVSEAPGQGYVWPLVTAHPKYSCGTVRPAVDDEKELVSLGEALSGPSASPFGDRNLVGGLCHAIAKCGFTNLKSFHRVELPVRPKGF